jgi:hypothetical protein
MRMYVLSILPRMEPVENPFRIGERVSGEHFTWPVPGPKTC